jgi:hydroxymethylglutaryl-CoA lyase
LTAAPDITLVEVGPRDGFQTIGPFIPTSRKIEAIRTLYAAGLRRIEATSFVGPSAAPQMADAAEVLASAQALPGLQVQVLVPTLRHAQRALAAGAAGLAFVISVSERHNLNNVRRTPLESLDEYARIVAETPPDVRLRLNIATAFDCPYDGPVAMEDTLTLLELLIPKAPRAEVALCDTTGRAVPGRVSQLFEAAARLSGATDWAFHGHDTYGLGAANAMAAWQVGIRIFDASVAGLGGCPFAPGATGNVATEDLVWMFEGMSMSTGVDLEALVAVARDLADLPGAQAGGRVRDALTAAACAGVGVQV